MAERIDISKVAFTELAELTMILHPDEKNSLLA